MPTAKTATRDLTSELLFVTRGLKAPTLRESIPRLAERAPSESWTHEEFVVACLQREVAAREAHGGEGRIRASRFPARKSLEEFDFDYARGLQRDVIALSARWTLSPRKTMWCSSAHPAPANPLGRLVSARYEPAQLIVEDTRIICRSAQQQAACRDRRTPFR
jgi:IstB-like ATP binding protein